MLVSHADRRRVISDGNRKRIASRNGQVPSTVLVDGDVCGTWTIVRRGGQATLQITLFGPIAAPDRDALAAEGARLLTFTAADAASQEFASTNANLYERTAISQSHRVPLGTPDTASGGCRSPRQYRVARPFHSSRAAICSAPNGEHDECLYEDDGIDCGELVGGLPLLLEAGFAQSLRFVGGA